MNCSKESDVTDELDRLIDTIRDEINSCHGEALKSEYECILKYLLEDKILRQRIKLLTEELSHV